jgi:hypothetical protein
MASDFAPPKVSKELANAVHDDWKRSVVDAAKHRAVAQMENYDGFKNMVSVAHLRPWHAENVRDHSGPAPPAFSFGADGVSAGPSRNPGALSRGGSLGGLSSGRKRDGAPDAETLQFVAPENSMQFDKTWRRSCKTAERKWRYLGVLRDDYVAKVFAVDITGNVLGEIVQALAEGWGDRTEKNPGEPILEAKRRPEPPEPPDFDTAAIPTNPQPKTNLWRGVDETDTRAIGSRVIDLLDRLRGAGRFDLARRLLGAEVKNALDRVLKKAEQSDIQGETRAVREAFFVS